MQNLVDSEPKMSEKMKKYLLNTAEERRLSSIEIRYAVPSHDSFYSRTKAASDPQEGASAKNKQAIWFRSRAKVPLDDAFQKCVLAYASDFHFIGTAAKVSPSACRRVIRKRRSLTPSTGPAGP